MTTYTEFMAQGTKHPNPKILHNYQHLVFFEDYNFDGINDLGIRDGNHNFDDGPLYQIYLFSPKTKMKFCAFSQGAMEDGNQSKSSKWSEAIV